jgi:hypothetical protein
LLEVAEEKLLDLRGAWFRLSISRRAGERGQWGSIGVVVVVNSCWWSALVAGLACRGGERMEEQNGEPRMAGG